MQDKLYDLLMKLPRHNLICLMEDALDYMQGYNGQSPMECIMKAMGSDVREDDKGHLSFKPPPLKNIKENTSSLSPHM